MTASLPPATLALLEARISLGRTMISHHGPDDWPLAAVKCPTCAPLKKAWVTLAIAPEFIYIERHERSALAAIEAEAVEAEAFEAEAALV